MLKLINYNSIESKILKELFQDYQIDPCIALIVESYIYIKKKQNILAEEEEEKLIII